MLDKARSGRCNLSSHTRDSDEMATALEQSQQAHKHTERLLAVKEAEVQRLMSEKRMLLKMIIEAGPWELWEWVKKEIVEQGLEPGPDFDKNWLGWSATNERFISSHPTCIEDSFAASVSQNTGDGFDSLNHSKNWFKGMDDGQKASLLRVLFSIVVQEGTNNLRYVLERGLFFLPMAWFYFWVGLSDRVTRCITGDMISRIKRSPFGFALHLI